MTEEKKMTDRRVDEHERPIILYYICARAQSKYFTFVICKTPVKDNLLCFGSVKLPVGTDKEQETTEKKISTPLKKKCGW